MSESVEILPSWPPFPRAADILDCLPDGVLVVDQAGRIVAANPVACDIFGYERLQGEHLESLVPDCLRATHMDHRREYHANPATRSMRGKVLPGRCADGTHAPVEVKLTTARFGEATYAVAIVTDVRQRLNQQAESVAWDRMLSAETLIGMVLHEISTPLAAATANFSVLIERLDACSFDDPEVFESLSETSFSLEHLADVVRDLGALTGSHRNRSNSLRELLERGWRLCRPGHTAGLELEVDATLRVQGHQTLLVQVFVNLFQNALDAMKDLGRPQVMVRARPIDGRVHIDFCDVGPGIEAAVRPRVFDPYFSTKGRDRISGMGLPVCRAIVEAAEGSLDLADVPGWATTFRVILPRASDHPTEDVPPAVSSREETFAARSR